VKNTTPSLNYQINSPEERKALVESIIAETPPSQLTPHYLDILSDYLVTAISREERRAHNILTENRLKTISSHETSYQGLAEKFESGEDGLYNLTSALGKSELLTQKREITERDLAEVPSLADLR
jgi:predicted GTPase